MNLIFIDIDFFIDIFEINIFFIKINKITLFSSDYNEQKNL